MRAPVQVAAGVWVATSRRDAATSTVLVDGRSALLIDPNWDPDELAELADWLEINGLTVVAGFSTHAHHDHLLWHPRFGNVARWASHTTAHLALEHRAELVDALGRDWPVELADLVGQVQGTDRLDWPGAELIQHDAHAPGSTALWLSGPQVLVAGDLLSDVELPLIEDSDLSAYRSGLDLLRPFAFEAAMVVPGHGSPGADAADRWRADDAYLRALATGEATSDERLANPGMRDAHRANRVSAPRRSPRPPPERSAAAG